MIRRAVVFVLAVLLLTACGMFRTEITPDKLIGDTLIATFESGAFPDSSITMQFVSSKDLVWKLSGNLGDATGSADYLISLVTPDTVVVTWRSEERGVSYVVTMDFDTKRSFLVLVGKGKNLFSEGVVAFE